MRIISYCKAREGKGTLYRRLIAEYLLDKRRYIDHKEVRAMSCKWFIYCVMYSTKNSLGMFQVIFDCVNKQHDHIEISQLKKRCKRKKETVYIMLY